MGKKSIICPFCGNIGTLGVEYRRGEKKTKSNWDHLVELRKEYPDIPDWQLIRKIPHPGKISIQNIPTKKYERKRNPIFKVYHTFKISGKPKKWSCYLGTNPINKIEKYLQENQDIVPKIDLDSIKKLILDLGGEIKNLDDPHINKLIGEVIFLKKFLYEYRLTVRKGLKDEHSCPHCNEKISISVDYDKFDLKKSNSNKKL